MFDPEKISIIIPTYNRAHLINATLDSIIAQTYNNWECLVVDDFSTDNTKMVIEQYSKKDNRIKYLINSRKKGAQGARNTGLLTEIGDFVIFFDSDDLMFNSYLEKKIRYFEKNPKVDIVTSFSHVLDKDSNIIGTFCWITRGYIHESILAKRTYADNNSAMIRKSFLDRQELLDENCPSYQEWDLHIQLSKTALYDYIPEFLTGYYRRGENTISSNKELDITGQAYVLLKNKDDFIDCLGLSWYLDETYKIFDNNEFALAFGKTSGLWDIRIEKYIQEKLKVAILTKLKRDVKRKLKRVMNITLSTNIMKFS